MTMLKYCDTCQLEVNVSIVERAATYKFKNESFDIIEKVVVCECGEELYDEILDSVTMESLKNMYESRIGLSLENIKAIRARYGLSMNLFAKILGWSKSTIARYETGKYIPSISHMATLKQLNNHPEDINEYYKSNQHLFTGKEQLKIQEILKDYDDDKVEKDLINAVNVNYKINDRTIESGYNKFDINKVMNMILFFTQKGVTKTKLMKLLFYSDFLNFKRSSLSISGIPYEKLPYGPVPKDHDLLLSSIEKNNIIKINYDQVNEYTYINIIAVEPFDETLFTETELDAMNFVNDKFLYHGSVSISDFSHKEEGWIKTNDRDIISYDYANNLQLN
ncbi:DUF4065 domain-containing protein [Sporosarcina sp. Marseille-Q4063]|uniref:type II TA system antitoxin MqsA family protein n=1 Tax=Sporosarcina sp. Marseille-Q4063 TaxID=2810514 RepID=UPI001BAF0BEB|nr:type II TA system antitoxin MqsA family protein [Sporosarcina sp. Marseille-Q4063]QUW20917.1 DUF4065 domain-containing protein [Sporosarcina sp. Marseille-Q4063]